MWYVYILRSIADRNLYVGSTNNIRRRLSEHNSGKVDSTKRRILFSLEAYIAVKDQAKEGFNLLRPYNDGLINTSVLNYFT